MQRQQISSGNCRLFRVLFLNFINIHPVLINSDVMTEQITPHIIAVDNEIYRNELRCKKKPEFSPHISGKAISHHYCIHAAGQKDPVRIFSHCKQVLAIIKFYFKRLLWHIPGGISSSPEVFQRNIPPQSRCVNLAVLRFIAFRHIDTDRTVLR